MKQPLLTVIILTFNEEQHIARAINSVREIAQRIIVVDSGSTDNTCKIASDGGAEILQNPWSNHATQFNWALDQVTSGIDWVLRLYAGEVVTPELASEINRSLGALDKDVDGVVVSRRITFLSRPIRYGKGRCENRWMDEHIKVDGKSADFHGEIIDDNLNSLTWWTEKHNSYASREVVDILNLEHHFMPHETVASLKSGQQAGVKRWLKERVYSRLPGGFRAFVCFIYRYIVRLGFLDGREGRIFHILQGFWYRFLVDAKLHEVRKYMKKHDADVVSAIDAILGINVGRDG